MALIALKLADYMEQKLEKLIAKTATILPHLARGCLCATFVEDSLRMATQWSEQKSYIQVWIVVLLTSLTGAIKLL